MTKSKLNFALLIMFDNGRRIEGTTLSQEVK